MLSNASNFISAQNNTTYLSSKSILTYSQFFAIICKMTETTKTKNGFEITFPADRVDALSFKSRFAEEYGIVGDSPEQRVEDLKALSVEGIAILMEDINKMLQESAVSLMNHESAMVLGEINTVPLGDRYRVFYELVESIKLTDSTINPARIGDTLAMGVVLLHPFHDGSGRTARAIGLLFRDEFDSVDYEENFDAVTESRDVARERGGWKMNGYTPRDPGLDQSDGNQVSEYLRKMLTTENDAPYKSCYERPSLLNIDSGN